MGINCNPILRLPFSAEEVCRNVDYVICTHTHFDHFDDKAAKMLNNTAVICQPSDTTFFNERQIPNVAIANSLSIYPVEIIRTTGQHGKGRLAENLGPVSGFILKAVGSPTIYIVGDCILTDEILGIIDEYSPDYIVLNSGGAINPALDVENGAFLMNEKDVMEVISHSPGKCHFIAMHMDALDHCQTNRRVLIDEANYAGIGASKLIIPCDGEKINLSGQ